MGIFNWLAEGFAMKWATEEELNKFDAHWLSFEDHAKNLLLEI